jgi:hypothetical protein
LPTCVLVVGAVLGRDCRWLLAHCNGYCASSWFNWYHREGLSPSYYVRCMGVARVHSGRCDSARMLCVTERKIAGCLFSGNRPAVLHRCSTWCLARLLLVSQQRQQQQQHVYASWHCVRHVLLPHPPHAHSRPRSAQAQGHMHHLSLDTLVPLQPLPSRQRLRNECGEDDVLVATRWLL